MNLILLATLLLQAGSGSIQGTVVRGMEVPESPLESARVELDGGSNGILVIRTNAAGEFSFKGLPAGSYRLTVKKEGYIRQEYEASTQTQGIVFRLNPAPTISGRVRNDYGFPVANILVEAMRRTYDVLGNRRVSVFSSALTDDRGEYRLYWLDPGLYYVNASYLPKLPTPVNANEDAPRAVYAPTYYPGTNDPANASPIELNTNEVGNIDFKLDRAPSVTVRGTTRSLLTRGPVPARVTLTNRDDSGSSSRYIVDSDAAGAFEMKNIVAGTYILSATTPSGDQSGFSMIAVADNDYTKADVLLSTGVPINGRFFAETPTPIDLRSTTVGLVPRESVFPSPEPAMVQPDGSFALAQIQSGNYMLRVAGLPEGFYVKSTRYLDRDVLESDVQVESEAAGTVSVLLGSDGAQLTGTVVDDGSRPLARSTIVLVPDKTRRHRVDQYRVAVSGPNGAFTLRGIPPGEYKLLAWQSVEQNAYFNSDFIGSFEELGSPVQAGPSAKLDATIRAISK